MSTELLRLRKRYDEYKAEKAKKKKLKLMNDAKKNKKLNEGLNMKLNREIALASMKIGCKLAEDATAEEIVESFKGSFEKFDKEDGEKIQEAFANLDNPKLEDEKLAEELEVIKDACKVLFESTDAPEVPAVEVPKEKPAEELSEATAEVKCGKCDWKGAKSELKDGKCPKCDCSKISDVKAPLKEDEVEVPTAKDPVDDELTEDELAEAIAAKKAEKKALAEEEAADIELAEAFEEFEDSLFETAQLIIDSDLKFDELNEDELTDIAEIMEDSEVCFEVQTIITECADSVLTAQEQLLSEGAFTRKLKTGGKLSKAVRKGVIKTKKLARNIKTKFEGKDRKNMKQLKKTVLGVKSKMEKAGKKPGDTFNFNKKERNLIPYKKAA